MKSVLISIQPKWVDKICKYEKTIEVRTTRPKIDTPFKCYIYCTIGNGVKGDYLVPSGIQCGKVIGEFVCERIDEYAPALFKGQDFYQNFGVSEEIKSCLSLKEVCEYGRDKKLYGWHISDLKIYDKPKDLIEFKHWVNNKDYDGWNEQRTKIVKGFVLRPLTRPPQSWCYVESLGE